MDTKACTSAEASPKPPKTKPPASFWEQGAQDPGARVVGWRGEGEGLVGRRRRALPSSRFACEATRALKGLQVHTLNGSNVWLVSLDHVGPAAACLVRAALLPGHRRGKGRLLLGVEAVAKAVLLLAAVSDLHLPLLALALCAHTP